MHDDDPLAVVHDEIHVVFHDEEGVPPLAKLVDVFEQPFLQRGVDARERLVQEQHVGVGQERPGHLQQLSLAAREVPGVLLGEVVDLEEVEHLPDAFEMLGLLFAHRPAGHRHDRPPQRLADLPLRREHHVLEDGHLLQLAGDLKRPREPPVRDLVGLKPGNVLSVEPDRPRGGVDHPGDEVERRRLARPVRADESGERPPLDVEANVVDGGDTAELLPEPLHLEGRVSVRLASGAGFGVALDQLRRVGLRGRPGGQAVARGRRRLRVRRRVLDRRRLGGLVGLAHRSSPPSAAACSPVEPVLPGRARSTLDAVS